MFRKEEEILPVDGQETNDNFVNEEPAKEPVKVQPVIPEITTDDPKLAVPAQEQQQQSTAVIPMSEWNKLYQGHIELKREVVGIEASIVDRQKSFVSKLKRYDEMLEQMEAATDSEIDRLSKFKDERFGK